MSEPEARKLPSREVAGERDKDAVLAAARPLPPDDAVLIDDVTEDEDRIFLAAVLDTWIQLPGAPLSSIPESSLHG